MIRIMRNQIKKKDKDFLVSIVRIDDGRPIGDLL